MVTAGKYARRPRVGDVIECVTGPEAVEAVRDHGRHLITRDRIGRLWDRRRADIGCWWVTGRVGS